MKRPLPQRWVLPASSAFPQAPARSNVLPLNFSARMRRLCSDVAARCRELEHINTSAMLFTFTRARNRSAYGLQARVTPMRFHHGALKHRIRGTLYQVQRYYVGNREVYYIVTFCLPRFLDQTFEEKLITVFHELYHISPNFDGDLRRHEGRYAVHSRSKRAYDERMASLARRYIAEHPDPGLFEFLKSSTRRLWRDNGGIVGIAVPRPQMVPVY